MISTDLFLRLFVISTLLPWALPQVPTDPPLRADIQLVTGEARIFSGEGVRLTCSVPGDPSPLWTYWWFRDGSPLSQGASCILTRARVQQSGQYTCQGERATETQREPLLTLASLPFTLHVDGGWAILQVPAEPMLIGETALLTCHIRNHKFTKEVIFYKDGTEIHRQAHPALLLSNLTLQDRGAYSCRATWDDLWVSHSAQSLAALVFVIEILTTPLLEVLSGPSVVWQGETLVLRCGTQFNTRQPDLGVQYYYLKDGKRLGPVTSHDTHIIRGAERQDAGLYRCKACVRELDLEKWSNEVQVKVREARG